jgi:hypothetical protein
VVRLSKQLQHWLRRAKRRGTDRMLLVSTSITMRVNILQKISEVEFDGIPSGDYESFCWDVDLETFIRICIDPYKKQYSDEVVSQIIESHKYYFNDGLYRLYPNDIFEESGNGKKCRYQITQYETDDLLKRREK